MWFADISCDFSWVAERQGVLGPPRFRLHGTRSKSLGFEIELLFFGDDYHLRHARVLMHTDSKEAADRCVDLNVQTWVASLEAAVMIETKRPFHVAQIPGPQQFAVGMGEGDETTPALIVVPHAIEELAVNYERIARGMAAWGGDQKQHLFYFRRFVDSSLPLDVRWLNGYRLLEWLFVRDRAGLAKSSAWRQFVARFDDLLNPVLRADQKAVGLLERARFLAAHAGIDRRPEIERANDPRNEMEKTFRALEQMVITALNERPATANAGLLYQVRSPESAPPKECV